MGREVAAGRVPAPDRAQGAGYRVGRRRAGVGAGPLAGAGQTVAPSGATSPGSGARTLPKSGPQARCFLPVPGGSVHGEAVQHGDDSLRTVRVGRDPWRSPCPTPPANAGAPGIGDTGRCPVGFGMFPDRETLCYPWALGRSALPSSM